MATELKERKGVEIFAAGKWNGDEYTIEDLDEMVRAFTENKSKIKPHLKLGHNKEQKLLQTEGLPAAGWVGNVYRNGSKLIADFVDIPNKIYQLIENKAYRKVSSEVYWNINIGGKLYKRMLSAVALLGADMPAVTALDDILGMYGLKEFDTIKQYALDSNALISKNYTFEENSTGGSAMSKTETEIKLELDLKAEKEKADSLITKVAAQEQELADLKKFKTESEAREAEALKAAEVAGREKTVTELVSEKLVTPAMKPYILELLGEEKKEYSLKVKDADKKFTKPELLKEILKLHSVASDVNFDESSNDEKAVSNKDQDALNEKIEKYATEHKVNYSAAYKAVLSESTKA